MWYDLIWKKVPDRAGSRNFIMEKKDNWIARQMRSEMARINSRLWSAMGWIYKKPQRSHDEKVPWPFFIGAKKYFCLLYILLVVGIVYAEVEGKSLRVVWTQCNLWQGISQSACLAMSAFLSSLISYIFQLISFFISHSSFSIMLYHREREQVGMRKRRERKRAKKITVESGRAGGRYVVMQM